MKEQGDSSGSLLFVLIKDLVMYQLVCLPLGMLEECMLDLFTYKRGELSYDDQLVWQ